MARDRLFEQIAGARAGRAKPDGPPRFPGKLVPDHISSRDSGGDAGPTMLCPICLTDIDWDADIGLYENVGGEYIPVPVVGRRKAVLDRDPSIFKKCPTPGEEKHYLPAPYGADGRPTVIGLVGGTAVGKSHLLAAMIGEIETGKLHDLGIEVDVLDEQRHRDYMDRCVRPLFDEGRVIERTASEWSPAWFRDGFVVSYGSHTRPIVFFDVSGEMLAHGPARGNQFMLAVDAFLFVVDPSSRNGGYADLAVLQTMRMVRRQSRVREIAAAIAITKCDAVDLDNLVAKWLGQPPLVAFDSVSAPDVDLLHRESQDAYAFLERRGMRAYALPYRAFPSATMHFVSATGSSASETRDRYDAPTLVFAEGVHPRRVLDPLISLLAMRGHFGSEARRLGRWPR